MNPKILKWKVQDRRMWNPEIGVWTAYIKTGDNVITIPVIAEDEQEAIDRAEQIVKCVNSYEAMREVLKDIFPEFESGQIAQHSVKADRMRNKLELRIKQALKESE